MAGDALRTPLAHLRPARDPSPASFVAWTGSDAGEVRVDVGDGAAGRTASRTVVDPDVETRPPAHPDVSGLSVRPPGDGPHPGVLLLHGSSGALPGKYARALATHGYAVLAPQYFGAPGLPASLDGVPLSSVDRALSGLAGRPDVRDGRVGVVGLSRGVEAALLTAAARDGPTAVVGYAGSGLVATGLDADGRPTGRAAWTRDGDPVVPADALRRSRRAVSTASAACDSLGCAVDRLRDDDRVPPAAVPVERVEGPVALFSGARDALWDAGLRSAYAARRLAARDHGHDFCHVSYGRAGHVFHVPYADYSTLAGPRLGGSPAANATAAADSWVRALDYLGVPAGAGE
jgi:dienelactone hydrolase